MKDILRQAPFDLDEEQIAWVCDTLDGLTLQQKVGQLINLQILPGDDHAIELIERHQLGAFTVINFSDPDGCRRVIDAGRKACRIPPLVCADLEGGVTSGHLTTTFPNQLGCAAAACLDTYGEALRMLSAELASLGVNWTFSPVLDVNQKFQSAVVGTRSYGSDPALIGELAQLHIEVFQQHGVATTAKHWPGEGFDDRDQHLVTTINPMTVEEWTAVFEPLYARAVEAGVLSVMSAHIAFPDYLRRVGMDAIELYRPASISRHLNQTLLREQLKFNGLIVSDATLMGGLESWGSRRQWLPEVIENGCDMILFSPSVDTDIETLLDAFRTGVLSQKRIDEALVRVLGLKARMNLHRPRPEAAVDPSLIGSPAHKAVMARLSDLSPTLVKDVHGTVPLDRQKVRKILMFKEENVHPLGGDESFRIQLDQLLAAEGFEVHVFDPTSDDLGIRLEHDLILYVFAQESQLMKSRLYIDWVRLHGGTLPGMSRVWWDTPTVFISFGHPYYLYDAPRVPCLINAYTPTPDIQRAVVDKLLGRSRFTGKSPVDAFCGLADAHF
ncbi:glycoside hydrolase family 3 protein [Leptothrix sp. BB-4]